MIRINLLGKKKAAQVPFGLDEHLAKLGISPAQFDELRPGVVRLALAFAAIYSISYIPAYIHDEKLRVFDQQLAELTNKTSGLQKELAAKKDIRKQMEQLNKEELELQRQLNAVTALQRDRGVAFQLVDNTVVSLPAKVWIDDMKFEKSKVSLTGRSWEYFPINDFVKTITESTNYTNVNFKEIRVEEAKKSIPGVPLAAQKTKSFGLEFNLKVAGEADGR